MSAGIVSRLPGRLRLRATELKQAGRNAALCRELAEWSGVLSAEGNSQTGGVLLHYDATTVAPVVMEARVVARLGELAPVPAAAETKPGERLWRMNRYAKWGMLGSLSGTLLALTVGKKMHAALGALHFVFLSVHLANHRSKLLK